jgi:alcohol dehydrogenase class IV
MARVEYNYRSFPSEIVCGPDEIGSLETRLAGLGIQRAMVVCGPNTLRSSDLIARVERAGDTRVAGRFDGAAQHAPVAVLREALATARELNPDALVSVGGGSALALANGLALLLSTDRDLEDFAARFEPPNRPLPPLLPLPELKPVIVIPTTMGGAEFSPSLGGFADESHTRKIIVPGNERTFPRMIIIDGQALQATPRSIQVGAAMGQLRVAIEAFTSRAHNPISDAFALHAMRTLALTLREEWSSDIDRLLQIKNATMLASMANAALGFGTGKLGVNSAIARQLGAICDLAHGEANAILLPHTIVFNAPGVGDRFLQISNAMGVQSGGRGTAEVAQEVAELVASLSRSLAVPPRLRDVGVSPDAFERIAAATMRDSTLEWNAVRIDDRKQVMGLLERAW